MRHYGKRGSEVNFGILAYAFHLRHDSHLIFTDLRWLGPNKSFVTFPKDIKKIV